MCFTLCSCCVLNDSPTASPPKWARVYHGCPCRDPPVCCRVQGDSSERLHVHARRVGGVVVLWTCGVLERCRNMSVCQHFFCCLPMVLQVFKKKKCSVVLFACFCVCSRIVIVSHGLDLSDTKDYLLLIFNPLSWLQLKFICANIPLVFELCSKSFIHAVTLNFFFGSLSLSSSVCFCWLTPFVHSFNPISNCVELMFLLRAALCTCFLVVSPSCVRHHLHTSSPYYCAFSAHLFTILLRVLRQSSSTNQTFSSVFMRYLAVTVFAKSDAKPLHVPFHTSRKRTRFSLVS